MTIGDLPFVGTASLSTLVVFALSKSLVYSPRKAHWAKPSSFFCPHDLMSDRWSAATRLFFGTTFSLVFISCVLAFPSIVHGAREALTNNLSLSHDPTGTTPSVQVKSFLDFVSTLEASPTGTSSQNLPSWLDPIIVLIIALSLYEKPITELFVWLRDFILEASGFYKTSDEICLRHADDLLSEHDGRFADAVGALTTSHGEAPLPEDYAGRQDKHRLAYQAIWYKRSTIRDKGLNGAFEEHLTPTDLPHQVAPSRNEDLRTTHYLTAICLFSVSMIFYVLVTPLLYGSATIMVQFLHLRYDFSVDSNILSALSNHEIRNVSTWPAQQNGPFDLCMTIARYCLAFAFPLVVGIYVYPMRRKAFFHQEGAWQALGVTMAIMYVLSLLFHEIFNVIELFINQDTSSGLYFALKDPKRQSWAFLNAMLPLIVLASAVGCRHILHNRRHMQWVSPIIIVAISSCSFSMIDYVYECKYIHDCYFIHQALLGAYMTATLMLARTLVSDNGVRRRSVRPSSL